jgi:hypothetical protein
MPYNASGLDPIGNESPKACGAKPGLSNFTATLAHEIAEAVTDPDPAGGWYDNNNGFEIGDLCNTQQATMTGIDNFKYVVQKVWSVQQAKCASEGLPRYVAVGDMTVLEGTSHLRTIQVPISLTAPTTKAVPVTASLVSTAVGDADAARLVDDAFLSGSPAVSWNPAVKADLKTTTKYVSVVIRGDVENENDETFQLVLAASNGYGLAGAGTIRILDDDPGTGARLSVGDAGSIAPAAEVRCSRFP